MSRLMIAKTLIPSLLLMASTSFAVDVACPDIQVTLNQNSYISKPGEAAGYILEFLASDTSGAFHSVKTVNTNDLKASGDYTVTFKNNDGICWADSVTEKHPLKLNWMVRVNSISDPPPTVSLFVSNRDSQGNANQWTYAAKCYTVSYNGSSTPTPVNFAFTLGTESNPQDSSLINYSGTEICSN